MTSEIWSPLEGVSGTLSPSRLSYASGSDSHRFSSDGDDSATHARRLNVSPSPSQYNDDVDDGYEDGNSIDEVDATLNNYDDDYGDTERSYTPWSSGSYTSTGPTFSSATGTFTYPGSYRGSPSFVSLPTFSPRSPLEQSFDPHARLSRITERTEESLPSSTAFSSTSRPLGTPENTRRSAFLGGGTTSFHSRASTEPGSDRIFPAPGRISRELIALFEPSSPNASHSRAASSPGRSSSPMVESIQPATTSSYVASYGHGSRPSSPSKLRFGSSASYQEHDTHSSLLSPPVRPSTGGFRASTGLRSDAPSYTASSYTTPSYTATPSAFSNTITGSYTTPNTDAKTITGSEDTFTRSTITPGSILPKHQSPPRSPISLVRNIVEQWKERTPASVRTDRNPVSPASLVTPSTVSRDGGRYGIRRRVEGARARLRGSRGVGTTSMLNPPVAQEVQETASVNSRRSDVIPPGFDLSEFSTYARSNDPPTHIGLLWYLNVHASPPYRWQRCQALLYPHVLLLSWLAPGGGRGVVALDLLNCTSIQSAPAPNHPVALDDVGTIAARQQSNENGLPLMDVLVPFHMMYADGVERLATESLLERQKWINRIWDAVSRPINVPDSVSVTRSPTGSIRTIRTIESDDSYSSNGSRTTVFVPPLSSIPDISDMQSSPGLSRRSSIVSSHHSRTVDDTVIQNQDYVYPGDRRSITSSRSSPLKRSGSMTDLDDEFRKAITRSKGSGGLFGSPVTVTSGSSLGKTILIPPPPTGGRVSSDEERFWSASSDGFVSHASSTYLSPTASISASRSLTEFTPATSATQVPPSSTFTPTFLGTDSDSEVSFAPSPSTLSRGRVIRRRPVSTVRSMSSGYQTEVSRSSSDKEIEETVSASGTPSASYGSYTPGSGSLSFNGSASYLDSGSQTPTGSYTGSYSGSEGSRSGNGSYPGSGSYSGSGIGSYLPSGDYTPGSGSYTLQADSNVIESSSSGFPDHTPISSSETGYDICPSSDLTDLTEMTIVTTTVTPIRLSPVPVPVPELPEETYVTVSLASTEYDTAPVLSSRASVTSFESLPTIPSEYWSAPSVSSYRTASEPSPPSIYDTAGEIESIPEIPSVSSTPKLSSIGFPELDRGPVRVPSVIPTIRSPESLISDLEAVDIPLPVSVPRAPTPLPSIEVPEVPIPQPLPSFPPISQPMPARPLPIQPALPPPISQTLPTRLQPVQPLPALPQPQPVQPLPALPQPIQQPLPALPQPIGQPLPALPPVLHPLPTVAQPIQPLPALPQPEAVSLPSQPRSSASPSTPTPVTALSTPRPRTELLSESASLSPTPSPLSPSTLERDVVTPTSIHLPPVTTESSITEDLSLLSSLSPSTLESTSAITPTSLGIVSPSVASTLPPSPRPITTTRAPSSSLSFSSVTLSSFTESSSPLPPSPHGWATATDLSYESSILRPSPSIRSVMLPEGMEVSFETSILRPTGSPSSIGRISTLPPSPTALSVTPHSPLPPLTPVPALPPSLSSATDIQTPTSLDFMTESSSISISDISISRTPSISSSSYSMESSLTPSTIDFDSEEPPVEFPSPSTEPSLLSTVHPPSDHPSVPSPLPAASIPTPEGTLIVSITTPQGSGATEQSSLRTIPSSISAVTQRDVGRDIDRLADEIRTNNQDLADNVRALRDELQGLTDYLRRTPSPRMPLVIHGTPLRTRSPAMAPEMPPRIQLVDRPAGDSIVLSPIPGVVEVEVPAPASSLARSTSNASSSSYLSSHHSDDDIFEAELETPMPSPAVWETPASETTSSSSISSSPVTPSSELESEVTTTMPEAPDALERALRGIQGQLQTLEDGQNNTRDLLEALQRQPEDHTPELTERLQRIENLIQTLLEQGHPRGPEMMPEMPYRPPSPSRTASISESTDSLRRLRSILRDLAAPPDLEPRMPIPTPAPVGPSIAQQLDDILSAGQVPPTTPSELPRIQPFVYRPADRGARARSVSPVSLEIPRSRTVPLVFPMPMRPIRSSMRPPREPFERDLRNLGRDTVEPRPADVRRPQQVQPVEGFNVGPGPPPRPVFSDPRPITAPPDIGTQAPATSASWYRQPQAPQPKLSTATAPAPEAPAADAAGLRYMPMPAGPTVVQLPPLFDSLMEILRENRLAQLATVDQQRELMRYMRGLNEWLERDVRDRQNEIRGVYAMVEQLGRDLRDMQARARRRTPSSPSSTDETETAIRYNLPPGPPPPFPGPPHGFQPFPVDQGPVIPPVIPGRPPGQPTIILQQPGQVIPGGPPFPRPEYHPAGPGPQPPSRSPTEDLAFIPPPPSRASTGPPLPTLPVPMATPVPMHTYPSSMGPNVVPYPESPPSSESPSTPSRRARRRRRDSSPSYDDSRTATPFSRRDARPPLTVTNGLEIPGSQPGPPQIHVVSPSVSSMPAQPTVILQQPPQQVMPPTVPYPPHPVVTDVGFPPSIPVPVPFSEYSRSPSPVFQPVTTVPVPIPPSATPQPYPGTPQPYPGTTVPVTPYPVTDLPTIAPYPITGVPTPYPMTAPVVIQGGSPRSTPSPSRRRHSPPPAPVQLQPQQPIIIDTSRRSASPPPIAPIATMPTGFPLMGAPFGPAPVIMPQGSPPRRHSRSRSRSPDRTQPIFMQPQPTMPSMYPPPISTVPPMVAPMMPVGAPVILPGRSRSHSRSRSRSPRHPAPPIIIQQEPGRRRSYSYSPRRPYSPPYRRRSPYERYDRDPYERDRHYGGRRYGPTRDESYSPSPPPRRRRPRSSDVSRSPAGYYAPTAPYPPTGPPPPSHYYSRRSPPYVEVIDIPQRRRRSSSPVRQRRSLSPEYERSPRDRRERYPRHRRSISPSYSRSPSPYPPPRTRIGRSEGVPEAPESRDAGDRAAEVPSRRATPRASRPRSASPISPPRATPGYTPTPYPATSAREESPEASPRSPSLQLEDETRPPIRVTVPAPTSRPPTARPPTARPPRDLAEVGPQEPIPIAPTEPTFPSERAESEEPFRPPRRPEIGEKAEEPFRPPRPEIGEKAEEPFRPPRPEIGEKAEEPFRPPRRPEIAAEPFRPPRRPEIQDRAEEPTIAEPLPEGVEREPAGTAGRPPSVYGYPIEDPREHIAALNRAADRLTMTVDAAEEAEHRRQSDYRKREEERMDSFLEQERQRNDEARERADAIWHELEDRLATLPPVPLAPVVEKPMEPEPSEPEEESAELEPIEPVLHPQPVAVPNVGQILELIQAARDEFAQERERIASERTAFFDELREEKDRAIEEKDNRVRALEEELQQVRGEKDNRIRALEEDLQQLRGEFQAERQQYFTEEAERREQDRQDRLAENNEMRTQISDLTNLMQNLHSMMEMNKAASDSKDLEKETRRQDKEAQWIEQRDMIQKIHDDRADDNRELLGKVEDLQSQNAELRELLRSFSENYQRHHEETLEAVRSTADKQVPFNVQGYLDEFSQALAAEVRMLLGEVGKIREERRGLQHEIGELLSMRSKYGPGGEYEPDWRPPGPPPPPPEAMGPGGPGPPPGGPEGPPPGGMPPRPAWRTVYPKPSGKKKKNKDTGASTSAAAPLPPVPMHPQHLMPPAHGYGDVRQHLARSWDTWQPDRAAVTPPSVEPTLAVPGRQSPGLFGPRSPSTNSNSMYERR